MIFGSGAYAMNNDNSIKVSVRVAEKKLQGMISPDYLPSLSFNVTSNTSLGGILEQGKREVAQKKQTSYERVNIAVGFYGTWLHALRQSLSANDLNNFNKMSLPISEWLVGSSEFSLEATLTR